MERLKISSGNEGEESKDDQQVIKDYCLQIDDMIVSIRGSDQSFGKAREKAEYKGIGAEIGKITHNCYMIVNREMGEGMRLQ